jgi:hypothetical protein
MKTLCHHVKQTLFYLWLKYEKFEQNNIFMSFSFDKITQMDIIPKSCLSTLRQPLVMKIIIISYHIDPNLHFYLTKE